MFALCLIYLFSAVVVVVSVPTAVARCVLTWLSLPVRMVVLPLCLVSLAANPASATNHRSAEWSPGRKEASPL